MLDQVLASLSQWCLASQVEIDSHPQNADWLCYGAASDGWGVQTQQKALAAFALAGIKGGNAKFIDSALKMLRYNLASHKSGTTTCLDGKAWGHTWISVLGTERMMHALEALDGYLNEDDRKNIKRTFVSEANWLLENYTIVAGEVDDNKPESNIWNGAFLHRVAMMYPDLEQAKAIQDKGTRFLINGISTADDASSETIYDGILVSEAHQGGNFFKSYALNHHHYLNVGYMVICLSNIAMLHFSYRARGLTAPKALYHRAENLWNVIRAHLYDDGRLWRIGGDTRVRYAYCQEYAIPMWLWVQDYLGEDCRSLIQGWLDQVYREQAFNKEGLYMSARLKGMAQVSPLYTTRLESDRAVTLSMLLQWLPAMASKSITRKPTRERSAPLQSWSDTYHGASMCRDGQRFCSMVWRAAGAIPSMTATHPRQSSMAEWSATGMGSIVGVGKNQNLTGEEFEFSEFRGGFLNSGMTHFFTWDHLSEQQSGPQSLAKGCHLVVALPDGHTCLVFQRAVADQSTHLKSVGAVNWHIPNDLFNNSQRKYQWQQSDKIVKGEDPRVHVCESPWIVVDDHFGLRAIADHAHGEAKLFLEHIDTRNIGIIPNGGKPSPDRAGGFLRTDVISMGQKKGVEPERPFFRAWNNDTLFDVVWMIDTDTSGDQIAQQEIHASKDENSTQTVYIKGRDGINYKMITNLEREFEVPYEEKFKSIAILKQEDQALRCRVGGCVLMRE